MFNEPCVHQSLYTDAVAIVAADSVEQALELLAASEKGWLVDELRRLPPRVISLGTPVVAFTDIRSE
ncbi:MAG: hypothetical protein AB9917_22150 [Negativicutes bacterium]